MTLDLFMEIFGYIGTGVVIISMLMTSVTMLRVINVCGGVISLIYAAYCNAWPIVLLNGTLVTINITQLILAHFRKSKLNDVKTDAENADLAYFRFVNSDDINKAFPNYNFHISEGNEAHLVCHEGEVTAILIGKRRGDKIDVDIDYAVPKHIEMSSLNHMYKKLVSDGVRELCIPFDSECIEKRGCAAKDSFTINLERLENK